METKVKMVGIKPLVLPLIQFKSLPLFKKCQHSFRLSRIISAAEARFYPCLKCEMLLKTIALQQVFETFGTKCTGAANEQSPYFKVC